MDIETRRTLELILKFHEDKSFSKTYWTANWRKLLLYHGIAFVMCCLFFWYEEYIAGSVILGSLIGTIGRDMGYFRSAKKTHPIYDMVTDYEKVKSLLQEE